MENSVQVPKFDGKNFASWKFRIVSILEGKELDDLLESDPPEDEVKFKEWKKKDAQAKGIITCAMTDSLVALILNCKTSKDIWIALHERYEGDKKKRIIEARNDVSRLTMKKEENWEEYLYRSEKLLEQARNLGAEIEDQEFTTSVIRGLPQKYNLVALQLNSQMKVSISDLKNCLKLYHERFTHEEKEGNSKAFNTIHKESFSNSKHFHKNRNGNKPICFICAKPGHKAIECWHNPKNNRASENKQTSKNKPEHQNKAKFVNLQPEEHVSNIKEYETTQQPEEWVIDSGASCHMTSNKDLLKEEREVHKTIKLADDSEIISNAEGAIEIEGQNKLIRLNDVLYVEKLSGNLMSVNKLVDDNKKVLFDKDGGHIMEEDGEEILMAQRINDFYIIKTSAPEEIPSQALKATLHTWNDWHKRLGHLNEEYMKQMLKNNSAHNFNTQSQNMDTCQVCIQAKHPRTPFKPVLYPQSTRPLDLIHIDLIGPIQEESIGGAKYVLTLVDDFSRKIFVEFLSSKLETFDIIRSFIEEIEKEKEIKVKQLRSDNGKEFTNHQMTQYLKGKGIKHQLTNVYTPQQNGISERYNRTLIEGTRALLIDSQLPLRYWAETMSTFAYLKNRTPCKKLGWITPEERFSNRKPTVAHLKIFGCIAYYYVHKHKRGKFQPTAKAGIFVGYSSTRKAWRLIDPENENVIETRDVKFLENKLGKEILNKNDSDDTQKYFLYNFPEETIPETSEEVENHDDHSHSDLENQDEHSELPYNLRPNLKDKLYYELSSDDEPIEDNEDKDPTYDPTVGALKLSHGNLLPSSYEEAINHPDSPLWQQAMDKEIHSLQNHHVWDLTELPEGAKAIKSKWIFSKKMDPQTNQEIYKARLVALGCSQEYGTDYTETFSPVMKTDSFRTLLAYATMAGYEFHHFDVETAFLYGKLSETIYMTQPPGYQDDKKKTSVCILNQALYGLKQSGRVWYETFTEYLFEIGLTQLKSDKCVFTFRNGNSHLLLGLHVDDMIIINSNPEILHDIIQKIRLHFKIKESLTTCNILGIEIIKEDVRLILKQENYINKILQKYNMQDCKHISTPLDPNTNLDNFNSSKEVNKTQYQELIGSLLYLSTKSRPDIAFAVTLLSRYNQNPREMHMGAAKRILRYLKGTKQCGLIYTKGDVELKAYTDASWICGRSNTARSTAGLTFYLDKNLISWSNGRKSIADDSRSVRPLTSTTNRKIGQVCQAIGEAIFLSVPIALGFSMLTDCAKPEDRIFEDCVHSPRVKPLCQQIQGVRRNIVQGLQRMLHQHNLLVQQFKTALENLPSDAYRVVVNADRTPPGQHPRRYNAPTANEVAVVLAGNQFGSRDIVLHKRDNLLQHVSDTHRFYDALQYPLIFWKGQEGYSFHIPQIDPNTRQPLSSKASSMDFYGYFIMVRRHSPNVIVQFGQLFHQFLVDMYAKVESERLRYITLHQRNLRAESYIHLRDALSTDANINPNSLGQRIILPSSFVNSPRYLAEYTQDAFCYVRKFGRPDLFITFTSNPSWEELSAALLPGQKQLDRHDITARVFRQKLVKFIGALTKGQLYGATVAWMYSVEWQKRGLPHAHILVWLENKLRSTQIDSVICAEFPDPIQDPLLYNIVVKNMIHGPCGEYNPVSPCMKNSSCSKKYPKQFLLETQTNENGYPLYRRRAPEAGGFTAKVRIRGREEVTIDNRWVVPYSPLLSKMFCAHINVENCSSVKAIKYFCKYVNKGSDQAIINLRREGRGPDPQNEVRMYQCARYICSNEAVWRLLSFPLHQRHPAVIHLAVHLENGERIYFNQNTLAHRMRNPPRTTLTAFFSLCQTDPFARTLLYPDVPQYYTWNSSAHEWRRRVQGRLVEGRPGVKRSDTIGRVYAVHVSNFECFCLRMLLHNIKGLTSFAYLKIVNGSQYETFRETCAALGLLENDNHWVVTMDKAVLCQAPTRVRHLFAILISTCTISNPQQLWITYRDEMASDILHRYQLLDSSIRYNDLIYNETLCNIEDRVVSICGNKLQELGLGAPRRNVVTNSDILRELAYDTAELEDNVASMLPKLLPEQRRFFDAVLAKINLSQPIIIFLDAPGGTGKTFLLNLLLAMVRKEQNIAIAVASSGIAATLLAGGRTAHSVLKLPLTFAEGQTAVCNIRKNSDKASLLRSCKLLVWDECTMAHKIALEALDRTLQDIRDDPQPMGGLVVLLVGDFRQTLPVVTRGTPADELNACLKSSYLWSHIVKMHLTVNMRVQLHNDTTAAQFADVLLKIGEGQLETDSEGNIQFLPSGGIFRKSIDTMVDPDESVSYPPEFLNSLELSGTPSHKIVLKVGVPVILIRNLDPPRLCNGTRLCITQMGTNVLQARILTGSFRGEEVLIPRIPIIPNDLPFKFRRLQFPVMVAFAMTINKSQGQTLQVVGVHLESPCFSHGQLYVACSRVSSP
ncbi:hypothetical protein LAZ67_2002573 [Cordylochernes scorpioides]|uniref:ATP-dependent DNA helicase n=1 Tax=Cordylochernes scorpioides TaxID=51811 RepID=A0ABY6K5A7_9ARAC|nr:hypothetical protein LAZ67_2002573 [Cordylochernes scorpioides]